MPYSMIEPIRDLLDAGVQSDRAEQDERWSAFLRDDVLDAELDLRALMLEMPISIGDFIDLRPGAVIPIDLPEAALVFAEAVPVFRARFGVARSDERSVGKECVSTCRS